jgi:hypothetical protein
MFLVLFCEVPWTSAPTIPYREVDLLLSTERCLADKFPYDAFSEPFILGRIRFLDLAAPP